MPEIIGMALLAAIGWALGFYVGGSHDWGFRVAVVALLCVTGASVSAARRDQLRK